MAVEITIVHPSDGATQQDLQEVVNIQLYSDQDSIDPSTIDIEIDSHTAYANSGFQCGFSGTTYTANDGYYLNYYFNIHPVTSYLGSHAVSVSAYADDGYESATETSEFTTECVNCLQGQTVTFVTGAGVYYTEDDDPDETLYLLFDSSTTNINILDDDVNAVYHARINENDYVAAATASGTSIIRNCLSSLCYGGGFDGYACVDGTFHESVDGYGNYTDGYCTSYNSIDVYIDELHKLYILNADENRIEVFYNIDGDLVGRSEPDYSYSASTVTAISGRTLTDLNVIEYFSGVDDFSNTLMIGTNNGLIRIDTDESTPGVSEGSMLAYTYNIDGSGATYEVLAGTDTRIIATQYNRDSSTLAVATKDATSEDFTISIIDLDVNVLTQSETISSTIGDDDITMTFSTE
jgi:hypothetical protein